jgi:hypothetical protein
MFLAHMILGGEKNNGRACHVIEIISYQCEIEEEEEEGELHCENFDSLNGGAWICSCCDIA